MINFTSHHEFVIGHRVFDRGNKEENLHGHNYTFYFSLQPKKSIEYMENIIGLIAVEDPLCQWINKNWDHKFLVWENDPFKNIIDVNCACKAKIIPELSLILYNSIKIVPFNPTAENIAEYFVKVIGPEVLPKDILLTQATVEETSTYSATYTL